MKDKTAPLRIAFGRLMQESNSFSSVPTTRADFERTHLIQGEELLRACQPDVWEVKGFLKNLELSGFMQAVRAAKVRIEALPLLSAWAISGGPLDRDFFDELCADLCLRLRQHGPVDGVMLALHGAMGVEGVADPEAHLLREVRRVVGEVPIAVTFDLHANLTREKMQLIDILCAYHTNPHYDMARTGKRAGELLIAALAGEVRPTSAWRSLPMLLGGGHTLTMLAPMSRVFGRIRQMEADPRVLNANVLMAHPYLDHPEQGWAVEVLTDNDSELAEQLADELAERCWQVRDQMPPEFIDVETMFKEVRAAKLARKLGSVAVCDTSDVVGAGGTGENTHLLKALLEQGQDLVSLVPLRDPAVVEQLWDTPEGSQVSVSVGGKLQPEVNPAIEVKGILKIRRQTENFGKIALLDLGHVQLVLTEGYAMPMKPDFYEDLGLDTRKADIVVTKNFFHFRIYYLTRSRRNLYVKTHGITDFERLLQIESPYPATPRDTISDWRAIDARKREVTPTRPRLEPVSLTNPRRQRLLLGLGAAGALAAGLAWHRSRRRRA